MINWRALPFVKLLVPILAGIGLGYQFPLPWQAVGLLALLVLPLLAFKRTFAPALLLLLFFAGWVTTLLNMTATQPAHYSQVQPLCAYWVMEVAETPVSKPDRISFTANVLAGGNELEQYPAKGQVKVYIQQSVWHPLDMQPGTIFRHQAKLMPVSPPRNPHEFDYQRYLQNKQITHQVYLYPKGFQILGEAENKGFQNQMLSIRQLAVQQIHQGIGDTTLTALAASMILGDRTQLDTITRDSFAISGAMHVLAISGLHVGIVAGILFFLLNGVWKRQSTLFKPLLIILFIWLYAALTGLSPSVLRASVMFSFLVMGKAISRKPNHYNSLAASALVLLVVNPALVLEIGFWLSYSAVVGILLLYPKIYAWIYVKSKWPNKLWQLLAVSLAAQLATLPITIYVFHQLPTYALLTNILVIPATTGILAVGLLFLTVSWVPYLGWGVAKVLHALLWITSTGVKGIAMIPFSGMRGIYINQLELALWVLLLLGFALWLYYPKRAMYLILTLGTVLLLLSIDLAGDFRQHKQQLITVYSTHNHTAMDVFQGRLNWYYTDSIPTEDSLSVLNKVTPHRDASGIKQSQNISAAESPIWKAESIGNTYLQIGGKRIAIVNKLKRRNIPTKPLQVDYLILTNNVKTEMGYLTKAYRANTFIIDRSNSTAKIKNWLTECEINQYPCYNAAEFAFMVAL